MWTRHVQLKCGACLATHGALVQAWGLTKDGRAGMFRWTVKGWRGEWDMPKEQKEPMCGIACGNKVCWRVQRGALAYGLVQHSHDQVAAYTWCRCWAELWG